jgi:hypothetical protein
VGRAETLLRCVECGLESDQLAEGWRAYLAPDKEEEPEGEIFMFCPECGARVRPVGLGGQRPRLSDMAEIAAGIALTLNDLLTALVGWAVIKLQGGDLFDQVTREAEAPASELQSP